MNIREILSELINGNHIWDYQPHLESQAPSAIATKRLVDKAHDALSEDLTIPIHIEMHGGLLNDVTCPINGVSVDDFVFYTNNNDFQDDDQRIEQIDTLSKMMAHESDKDRIETYKHLIDRQKRALFVPGADVDVFTKSKETIAFYGSIVEFQGTIVSYNGVNDYYLVEDQEENLFCLKLADISLAEV